MQPLKKYFRWASAVERYVRWNERHTQESDDWHMRTASCGCGGSITNSVQEKIMMLSLIWFENSSIIKSNLWHILWSFKEHQSHVFEILFCDFFSQVIGWMECQHLIPNSFNIQHFLVNTLIDTYKNLKERLICMSKICDICTVCWKFD